MSELKVSHSVDTKKVASDLASRLGKKKVFEVNEADEAVYALYDASGSMIGLKWQELLKAATVLNEHAGRVQITTIAFNNYLYLEEEIENIHPECSTHTMSAATYAINQAMNRVEGKRRIILVTDGHPSDCSNTGLADYVRDKGVIIDTVGIGEDCDKIGLEAISNATGGKFYHCKDGEWQNLSTILLELSPEMRYIGCKQDGTIIL